MLKYLEAYTRHRHKANRALALLDEMTGPLVRVPGMTTAIRLAWRIECGRSVEEAAAGEYIYRWSLALNSPIFGVPHAIGF